MNQTHDSVLIKWRAASEVPIEKYQGALFDMSTTGEMLRMRWTAEYDTQGAAAAALALLAEVTPTTPCTGTDDEGAVKCYKVGRGRGGSWQGI
ncbi:MAG: hypothetical protein NDJ90_12835 [Oligoflexia bacterium]|nr:hypothetical protein [Oligoflexia bacterium]